MARIFQRVYEHTLFAFQLSTLDRFLAFPGHAMCKFDTYRCSPERSLESPTIPLAGEYDAFFDDSSLHYIAGRSANYSTKLASGFTSAVHQTSSTEQIIPFPAMVTAMCSGRRRERVFIKKCGSPSLCVFIRNSERMNHCQTACRRCLSSWTNKSRGRPSSILLRPTLLNRLVTGVSGLTIVFGLPFSICRRATSPRP